MLAGNVLRPQSNNSTLLLFAQEDLIRKIENKKLYISLNTMENILIVSQKIIKVIYSEDWSCL